MTTLAIIANYEKKRLKCFGAVAAGEHVAVTITDGAQWIGEGTALRLRVLFGPDTVAVFPFADGDAWTAAGQGDADAACELNLNTVQAEKYLKHGGTCLWILDDVENHTLYATGEFDVLPWPKRRGIDEPIDLDGYPLLLDEINGLREDFEEYQRTVAQALAEKQDTIFDLASIRSGAAAGATAVQPAQIAGLVDGAEYVSQYGEQNKPAILLKHGSSVVGVVDATPFVKDGMVSNVITTGNTLVITFNTDAGKQPISVPIPTVFNPDNYYDRTAADGKFVAKEAGKGLSTEDYTTAEKTKLGGIAAGAQVNVIETVKVNGTALTPQDKAVNIPVPTLDNAVTPTSANGVKSSGIWSIIWGALSALPTGFVSLYDWCVSQLAGKVPTSRTVNGKALSSDVTLTGADIAVSGTNATKINAALAGKIGNSGNQNLNGRLSFWDGNLVFDFLDAVRQPVISLFNVIFLEFPSQSGTLALTAGTGHAGNLAALDTNGNPTDSGIAKTAVAPLASPALTGTPTAPTPTAGDNSTKVATTAFVQGAVQFAIETLQPQVLPIVGTVYVAFDRAINQIDATSIIDTIPLSLPSVAISGKSRDFYVAVRCGATVPTMTVSSATLQNAKGESADLTLTASATTVLRFTEVANGSMGVNLLNPVFVVTGGANGSGSVDPAQLAAKLNSTSAAPAYDPTDTTTTYAVGDHVTYNGVLYECVVAVTSSSTTPDQDIYDDSTTPATGHWKVTDMTSPDAVLDVTSQNQLRVVAKDGTLLWAQGYDLASSSSATLACDAVNNFTFADGATTQAFALPTAPTGKAGDFGLDIDNSANTGAATMTLTGLDTTFSVVVPEGESLTDMLAIAAGELARFYVTLTTFRVNNLPTWHIVKQVVENGGAQS